MLKHRIAKLEAVAPKPAEDAQIGQFIVDPGHLEPPGYECEGVTINRRQDETHKQFTDRCFASVTWANGIDRKTFHPVTV